MSNGTGAGCIACLVFDIWEGQELVADHGLYIIFGIWQIWVHRKYMYVSLHSRLVEY